MTMLLTAIIVNTLLFGLMGFNSLSRKYPLDIPLIFSRGSFYTILPFLYWASFLFILFSDGEIIRNFVICIALQFFVNHLVWGIITGAYLGKVTNDNHTGN